MATKVTILGMDEPKKPIEFKVFFMEDGSIDVNTSQCIEPSQADKIVLVQRSFHSGEYDYFNVCVNGHWFPVLGHFNDGIV
jgi:hypothetical protein